MRKYLARFVALGMLLVLPSLRAQRSPPIAAKWING